MKNIRPDENGYELWMRYQRIENPEMLVAYRDAIQAIFMRLDSPSLNAAKDELERGLTGLLSSYIPINPQTQASKYLFCGQLRELNSAEQEKLAISGDELGDEGFAILSTSGKISIVGN